VKSSDESGGAYALLVLTPIVGGREDELRADLESLGRPLAELPRTHFGRWLIVPRFTREAGQVDDPLEHQYLSFSACFDGPLESYLVELCTQPWAPRIWGRCVGCGPDLKGYLLRHQVHTGFFVAAYGNASVAQVRERLATRERLIAFALRAQGLAPAELQRAFVAEFPA
jgi:hypothetical protein